MTLQLTQINNFISNSDSNLFINFHKQNFNLKNNFCKIHRKTEVIECYKILNHPLINDLSILFNNFIKLINKNYIISYFEIVKWPVFESQVPHLDFKKHPYTSILYLNDNFKGGETVVGNETIIPNKNKLISFEGNKIVHSVNEIKEGIRYTIPCWYKYES